MGLEVGRKCSVGDTEALQTLVGRRLSLVWKQPFLVAPVA